MPPCDLNKWSRAAATHWSIMGLKKSCIYSNISLFLSSTQSTELPARCKGEGVKGWGNWRQRLLHVRILGATLADLFWFALPRLFSLSLTSPFQLTHSPSLNVFLALPSQLSLIACEVINGFHLTSSPTPLCRAPTNKKPEAPHNTQIVPPKSRKKKTARKYGGCKDNEAERERDLAFGKKKPLLRNGLERFPL